MRLLISFVTCSLVFPPNCCSLISDKSDSPTQVSSVHVPLLFSSFNFEGLNNCKRKLERILLFPIINVFLNIPERFK